MNHMHQPFDNQSRGKGTLSGFIALSILSLLAAAPAAGHLRLTSSVPESDAALERSPDEIHLWFSLAPELAISRISFSCHDTDELGDLQAGDNYSLYAEVLGDLLPGSHTIAWRTSSGDGHPIRGAISFSILSAR